MKTIYLSLCTLLTICLCNSAHASVITEISTSNNTVDTAQNIDSYFSIGENPDIINSLFTPWVSIQNYGDTEADFYSFTASAGATVWLDIDYGKEAGTLNTNMDSYLILYIQSETIRNNDHYPTSDGAAGSVSVWDSYIEYTFAEAGTYYVSVNNASWNPATIDQTYTLQVSVSSHPTSPTPEPATMLLFGTGIAGLIGIRTRKKENC